MDVLLPSLQLRIDVGSILKSFRLMMRICFGLNLVLGGTRLKIMVRTKCYLTRQRSQQKFLKSPIRNNILLEQNLYVESYGPRSFRNSLLFALISISFAFQPRIIPQVNACGFSVSVPPRASRTAPPSLRHAAMQGLSPQFPTLNPNRVPSVSSPCPVRILSVTRPFQARVKSVLVRVQSVLCL